MHCAHRTASPYQAKLRDEQWRSGRENCDGQLLLPLIFGLWENVRPKMQNLGLNPPILEKYRGKIGILSTDNLLCQTCGCISENCSFLPRVLINPRRRWG